jgi:hemerythrin-like metal-binding protein
MGLVMWNPEWETGVDQIDQQHRQLLAKLEDLFLAIHEDQHGDRISGILTFLANYVETHFATEEFHMQATDYPGFSAHKAIHDALRVQVAELIDGFGKDPAVMTEAVVDYLQSWLINHIDIEDRRMALHLIRLDVR